MFDCDVFFRRVAETTGGVYTPDEIRRVHDAWVLEEYPGVGELIDRVHAAGLETGVLSNTNHAHWERMELAGEAASRPATRYPTPRKVRHLHASHLLRASKPDERIYRLFEREAGYAGRGREILFFDDLPENVEAARAAGWHAERIDHSGDTAAQMAEHLRRHGVRV